MHSRTSEFVPLSFTKLIVDDADSVASFYEQVCGLIEEGRSEDQIGGRPILEVYFKSDPPGTGTFTLTKFLDAPKQPSQDIILGFLTGDIEGFVERALGAGAQVVESVHERADHGVKVAFLKDIEGNLIEVVELL